MTDRPWAELETEAQNPTSLGLDQLATPEIVTMLLQADRDAIARTLEQASSIATAADWFAESFLSGGVVYLVGAGTSGRLAVLEAAECPPTFGTRPDQIQGLIAGGEDAVFRAKEGAEDDIEAGRATTNGVTATDLVVGLSASSVTRFTLGALTRARELQARTILLTCAACAGLEAHADLVIGLDTGPEILTGSTRLKAGSATKAALNAISTAAMVRAGKVYDNLMVDLRQGSAKLVDRAHRITMHIGQVDSLRAKTLLDLASGNVKVAVVMARCNLDVDRAHERLSDADGHLRRALKKG